MTDITGGAYDPIRFITDGEFDFDYWAELHKESPEKFEKLRTKLIETTIDNMPEKLKRRGKGLAFRMNAIREKSNNPIQSCIESTNMMWEEFSKLQDVARSPLPHISPNDLPQAKILKFEQKT